MNILADADFLVALAKEDDINHERALKTIEALGGASIFVTPFTIPEAATVLSYKVSHVAAKKFLASARNRNFVELPLNQELVQKADDLFLSVQKKGTSWIDCLNVGFTYLYRLDGILSFDKFYQRVGVKMLSRP